MKLTPAIYRWSLIFFTLLFVVPLIVSGQERRSRITITDPISEGNGTLLAQGSVDISFSVESDEIEKVKVKVENTQLDVSSKVEEIDPNKRENTITVDLFKGRNYIRIVGMRGKRLDYDFTADLQVVCNGKKCKSGSEAAATEAGEEGPASQKTIRQAAEVKNDDAKKKDSFVQITLPTNNATYKDATFIDSNITIDRKSDVEKLLIQVYAENKSVDQGEALPIVYDGKPAVTITPRIKLGKGKNVITVFNASKPLDDKAVATATVTCEGNRCGAEADVATVSTNSVNTRAVVGFEQAGASSANSETKPFLDLFFTGPLLNGGTAHLPRLATWGQIRLSTTPEQTAAAGAFPSNLVNQVAQSGKTVDLVQSFDYLAGLEFRVFPPSLLFPSLLPNVKQRIGVYVAGGGGAISPLSTRRESAQIFKVPDPGNGQFQLFKERFGEDAVAKKYIAFVLPERDRFLRQYYAGLRFKTYFYDKDEVQINRFPAILDVMLGQNEAVTGGKLRSDETDPTGKIIGKRRSWVLRLDGFYPLPIRDASFLYLYGTALMKVGGGGVKISTPLFLDTAPGDILVTNNDVFVAPNLQLDRDYYKIGVGINLTDLFNRKPKDH